MNKNISELDERKQMILKVIIKTYLEKGEPVGSRTISKLLDISLSSATIRNEMSDLEELGYIEQPHTSAGRIPSDKGYRFYVDNLLREKDVEIDRIKTEMYNRVDKLENMMKDLVKVVASNTNYAALIKGPTINDDKFKYLQISALEDKKVLVVIVSQSNEVKTHIIDIKEKIAAKDVLDISVLLNNLLTGRKITDVITNEFKKEINRVSKNNKTIKKIIDTIEENIKNESAENQIYTFGANNLFKYKEFAENKQMSELVSAFEHKNELATLVNNINEQNDKNNTGLRVYIGEESSIDSMKDCSVVTAKCDFGNGLTGTIGVIGPKRMDYEKVLKTLTNLMEVANKQLK